MHVYTQSPSSDTLQHALGELQAGVEGNAELAEHVETITDALKRSMPALPKVVWEGDSPKGRYRVVGKFTPGSAAGPTNFVVERGTRDALGEYSWNWCGKTTPGPVFQQILRDYCRLLGAGEQEASVALDHVSREVTRQHVGVGEGEGEGGDS